MKKIILLIGGCLLILGCSETAENPVERFNTTELSRFTIKRESTPSGYPDLFLIHDSVGGSDYLAFSWDHHGIAIVKLSATNAP